MYPTQCCFLLKHPKHSAASVISTSPTPCADQQENQAAQQRLEEEESAERQRFQDQLEEEKTQREDAQRRLQEEAIAAASAEAAKAAELAAAAAARAAAADAVREAANAAEQDEFKRKALRLKVCHIKYCRADGYGWWWRWWCGGFYCHASILVDHTSKGGDSFTPTDDNP